MRNEVRYISKWCLLTLVLVGLQRLVPVPPCFCTKTLKECTQNKEVAVHLHLYKYIRDTEATFQRH